MALITVTGIVKHSNGNAVPRLLIHVYEKMIRDKKLLGESKTDANGKYSIQIELPSPNTAIVVSAHDDKTNVIAMSDIIYTPDSKEVANLTVSDNRYKGDSTFKKNGTALKSYQEEIDKTAAARKVTVKDVHFMARQSGKEDIEVWHSMRAHQLESETKLPAEAFYAMFQQGLSTNIEELLRVSLQDIEDALKQATAESQISDDLAAKSGTIVQQWKNFLAEHALNSKPALMDASLSNILGIAVPDKSMQQKILGSYLEGKGTIESFWQDLSKLDKDKSTAERVQKVLQFSALTGNQLQLTKALMSVSADRKNGYSLQQLAEWDDADWKDFIKANSEGKSSVPTFIKGNSEGERIASYAGIMKATLAAVFPTQAFFGKLKKENDGIFLGIKDDLLSFYVKNPSFDIRSTATISLASEQTAFNFTGVKNKNRLITGLQSIQRLSALTQDFDDIKVLKSANLDSSYSIMSYTKTQFTETYAKDLGSESKSANIYEQAEKTYMSTLALYAKLHYGLNFALTVTPGSAVSPTADPTLRTMFGSLDACDCEACTSVFSAAAYYADILNFLYTRAPKPYKELIRRRPDLPFIELNCDNTNTPLPYVDLVIELLENFVLTHKTPPDPIPDSYQTTWQAGELAANPEHINYSAYDELKKAVFPHVLPFTFPLEEARVYLKHLGVPRHLLMTAFFPGNEEDAFNDFNICMERLLLSQQEAKVLTGKTTGNVDDSNTVSNFYGFNKDAGFKPLTDPQDSSKLITGTNWINALTNRVDVFLQQTELSYKELLTLLLCDFINPIISGNRKIGIVAKAKDEYGDKVPPDTCDLHLLELKGMDGDDLEKIHRFLRLWRKLGWSMYELDLATKAFGISDYNTNGTRKDYDAYFTRKELKKISQAVFLKDQLRVSVESILAFWSPINATATYRDWFKDNYPLIPSLYEKLFRNKSVINPADIAFMEDPASLTGSIDDHTASIFAALQIGDTDYGYLKSDGSVISDTDLTLNNLSSLYHHALLAKKLKLTVKDFLSLKMLVGIDPFADPLSTFRFISKALLVKASGFSIDMAQYLVHHIYLAETAVAPDDATISVFLSELRAALRGIETATAEDQKNIIAQKFSEKLKITTTAARLLLRDYIKSTQDATKSMENDFRADDFSTSDFLKSYPDPADNSKETEPLFARIADPANPLQVMLPVLFDDYMKLDKIATFVNKLKLSDTELGNILTNAAIIGCTDLVALSVTAASGNFISFETLIHLIQARDLLPIGLPDYFDILGHAINTADNASDAEKQAAKELWLTGLTTRTNWDRSSLESLVGTSALLASAGILQTSFPVDFRNGDLLLHISKDLKLLAKIGLHTEWISAAVAENFDDVTSQAIKNAAKSKYDEAQWLKLAKPLRDDLRERQRAALTAFAIANPASSKHEHWKNSDELYEYFLIDVEMKPVSMTSRIKQAICSVQLFIDRVLMNLEHPNSNPTQPVLKLGGEEGDEWKEWRKIYRIWEANRKIFLYPENWLEPELRDDKSPFFKELEAQLLQNELSDENIEDAFYNYLEKLDGVARLEVVGLYHQHEKATGDDDAIDILHVFARSYPHPHKYFYRSLEDGEWSAWEKLEIDIDGDHIVPVIFNRRLCLFWLFLSPQSEEKESLDPGKTVDNPMKFWKIQVAWSEFKNNKWTAKRLSKRYVETTHLFLSNLEWKKFVIDPLAIHTDIQSNGKLRLHLHYIWPFRLKEEEYLSAAFLFNDTNNEPELDLLPWDLDGLHKLDKKYPVINPKNTEISNMMLEEKEGKNSLWYDKKYHYSSGAREWDPTDSVKVLGNTGEGLFKLVTCAYYTVNPLSKEFFFQDSKNTFYVKRIKAPDRNFWTDPNKISLGGWSQAISETYPGIYTPPSSPEPIDPLNDPEYYFSLSASKQKPGTKTSGFSSRINSLPVNGSIRGVTDVPVKLSSATKAKISLTTASENKNTILENNLEAEYLDSGLGFTIVPYYMENRFTFSTFYHAHVKSFIKRLNRSGVKGLLNRKLQSRGDDIDFDSVYDPRIVTFPYPKNEVDFEFGGAYSQYNWELFFHVPMIIACRLSTDQRFEEARDWFHYIFDPTQSEGGDKERFWQFLPFWKEAKNKIETLDDLLRNETELAEQIDKWMEYPFQPHVIARMRISAYMKNVVMKYLDNLIAWGDQLFRRDTIEQINEATNLYIIASQILGERPQDIPPRASHADYTFDEIKDKLDDFSNAMVNIETFISPAAPLANGSSGGSSAALGKMFYFCVPKNDYILKYWDTVADRLFKIRNSMNIEGVVRMLPLFEPPIDPAMLVRAAAAGMDLSSILSDMTAALPPYRFTFMLQKANELCNEVRSLGGSLLQALEKRDAEAMALLKSNHEQKLLKAVLRVKEKAVDESANEVESAKTAVEIAKLKFDFYRGRPFMNSYEQQHLNSLQIGMIFTMVQGEIDTIGSALAAIPNLKAGAPTSAGVTWGGDNLGQMMHAIAQYIGIMASINNTTGIMASTLGGYSRRMDDWTYQADNAKKEIQQAETHVLSAEIKLAMAERELENHQLQMDNAAEEEDFLRNKFSDRQLYEWMIGQIATVYFQSYQLAYDLAKKAEQCYQYELGQYGETSFIQFGYWDSLKKGLLSGEKLQYDLRRMETSFYEENKRELELNKNVSLVFLNPQSILDLRQTGKCSFVVPEALYDLDFQGHYFRRIKSVAVSIPCIAGPYTTISCTLRLQSHTVRLNTSPTPSYESDNYGSDLRFRHVTAPVNPIAISSAQNDAGIFELNFKDERYLPFEGCGAISQWELALNEDNDLRLFDYNTIADIILHIKYTAREDAGLFKNNVRGYLKNLITSTITPANGNGLQLWRMFSLKHEFPTEWYSMLHPSSGVQQVGLQIDNNRFPFFAQGRDIQVKTVHLYGTVNTADDYTITLASASGAGTMQTLLLTDGDQYHDSKDVSGLNYQLGQFMITIHRAGAQPVADNDLRDLMLVLEYQFQ